MRDTSTAMGRRPLTARSVIASTLLGVDPPRLPARALVRSGELFGLSESATRTALSRMAAAGEVVADDDGYALVGPLLARHARQQVARASSARGETTGDTDQPEWDGSWALAVVTSERRPASERAAFRSAAARLHLAEVREGLWARPDDLDLRPETADAAHRATIDDQATWVHGARPDDIAPFVGAFDLAAWATTADALIDELRASQPALDRGDASVLGTTFVTAAAVLRHLVADPALPPALLPDGWPGPVLRATFEPFDRAFKTTWRAWYRQTFGTNPDNSGDSRTV